MLVKILFTIAVIIGVTLFFRNKRESEQQKTPRKDTSAEEMKSLSSRALAYGLIGLLVILSSGIYIYHWHQGNRIINIQVTSEGGQTVHYQAHHKNIEGRQFTTMDGRLVTLGESDRIEIFNP